ncbi:GTP-binding protein YchF [Spizellomyces punctatus DAOM BR117]|uniref:Obg-like ATPase 1 n=1 Tax=Spizellomyces punctatus (strain DAOM BR117) TaxID=645134 RepID=A0A0L0H4Q2_SPIPD|nr:GTP-binding protein YchF [Spizellomyces punctatus DAOM BR117]KNC96177.1 GTP-binding protein YchF [Spizellomyces punctatus DAOM BR117]|eukprot:XP_016604217.1 GTP-binding protein YchF [Spizellomyces punctatus DAOM BR117]
MPPKKAAAEPVNAVRFGRVKNNLKMGVVGLPNVGKSSLFNLMTEQAAAAENYPFCTIEPNESRCPVPDARYDYLCDIWKPPSMYPAYLHITDIAGLIKGASEGQGLGNAFLSHIQAVDGIYHVVRAFDNPDVVHVDDSVDPVRDLETILSELCKKDLEIVGKAITAEELAVKKAGGKYKLSTLFLETMEKLKKMLEENIPVSSGEWSTAEVELINEKTRLITTKPVIYLVNLSKADFIRRKNKWLAKIAAWVSSHGGGSIIPFSIEYEQALWEARTTSSTSEDLPVPSTLPKIITTGYSSLNLIYFFTAGEKEVRAWCVYNGALAPQAAGVIHSDFERGFIKAEVVAFDDFKSLSDGSKSMAAVKAAGKYRQEGKAYVVKDGDIIHFQFNVTAQKKK